MNTKLLSLTKYRLSVLATFVTCLGLLIFALSRTSLMQGRLLDSTTSESKFVQGRPVQVDSQLTAIRVVNATVEGGMVRLLLKNESSKTITAFTLASGSHSGVEVDFSYDEKAISPGETYPYSVAAGSLAPQSSTKADLVLSILAIVFEDGTSDGDPQAVQYIKNRWEGERIALEQLLPLFDQELKAPQMTISSLGRLKMQVSTFVIEAGQNRPAEIVSGMQHGKNYILGELQRLERLQQENNSLNLKEETLKIKIRYKGKSAIP